jgi:hypothetical protein
MVVQGENTASAHVEPKSARPRWADLPGWQQAGIVALAAAEVVLTTVAVVDLVRRPRRQVRGPKALWAVGFGVQPFGPVTYLLAGRRR